MQKKNTKYLGISFSTIDNLDHVNLIYVVVFGVQQLNLQTLETFQNEKVKKYCHNKKILI